MIFAGVEINTSNETAYVAGPMRKQPYCNFPQFDSVARWLRDEKGWRVYNPAEHDLETSPGLEDWPGFEHGDVEGCPDFDLQKAMAWDLAKVAESDHMVLLPGWRDSVGAQAEKRVAEETGSKIWTVGRQWDSWFLIPSTEGQWISSQADLEAFVDEVRITDPVTGGQKGQKPSQLSQAPWNALLELGKVFSFGAQKYDRFNYRRGYAWSLSADALLRHFGAWLEGEDNDPESGVSHLLHACWHALNLWDQQSRQVGTDDRFAG